MYNCTYYVVVKSDNLYAYHGSTCILFIMLYSVFAAVLFMLLRFYGHPM